MVRDKKIKWLLVFLLIAAGFLRLLGLANITLAGDFLVHWHTVASLIEQRELPLLGPVASINKNIHLPPFYYYLLSIPYFLGHGNYKMAIIFFSLISTFSVFLLFKSCQYWFSDSLSLKIAALYAFSSYMIRVGNFAWNPYILPSLIILSLYFLTRIWDGHTAYIFFLFLSLGLAIQSHATALFLLPVFLSQIPYRKIKITYIYGGFLLFLLSLLPFLIAELQCQFCNFKQAINVFLVGFKSQEKCNLWEWLAYHGHGESCFHQIRTTLFVFRFFAVSLLGTKNRLIVFVTILVILFYFKKGYIFKVKSPTRKFFLIWLIIPTVFFLFYSSNIYLHYFLIFTPLPFIFAGQLLEEMKKIKYGRLISNLSFYSILVFNIIFYLSSLNTLRG